MNLRIINPVTVHSWQSNTTTDDPSALYNESSRIVGWGSPDCSPGFLFCGWTIFNYVGETLKYCFRSN